MLGRCNKKFVNMQETSTNFHSDDRDHCHHSMHRYFQEKKNVKKENACLPPLFTEEILTVLEFSLLLISI
jgi:hypothetical protein